VNTGREQYLQALAGLRETTRTQAERVAGLLAKQGEVQAGQASRVAEDLLRRTRSNREQVSRLIQREVKRQLGAVGIATREEVARLQQRVRALEQAAERSSRPAGGQATGRLPRRRVAAHVDPDPDHRHKIQVVGRLAGHRPPGARWSRAHGHEQRRHRHRQRRRRLAHRPVPTAHAAGVAAAPILDRRSGFGHRGPAGRGRPGIGARRSPWRTVHCGAGLPAGQAYQLALGAASGKPPGRE